MFMVYGCESFDFVTLPTRHRKIVAKRQSKRYGQRLFHLNEKGFIHEYNVNIVDKRVTSSIEIVKRLFFANTTRGFPFWPW